MKYATLKFIIVMGIVLIACAMGIRAVSGLTSQVEAATTTTSQVSRSGLSAADLAAIQ